MFLLSCLGSYKLSVILVSFYFIYLFFQVGSANDVHKAFLAFFVY